MKGCLIRFFFPFSSFVFQDKVRLCSPGCPGICFVDQAGFERTDCHAFESGVLGLKYACATMSGCLISFLEFLETRLHHVSLDNPEFTMEIGLALNLLKLSCLWLLNSSIKGVHHNARTILSSLKSAMSRTQADYGYPVFRVYPRMASFSFSSSYVGPQERDTYRFCF